VVTSGERGIRRVVGAALVLALAGTLPGVGVAAESGPRIIRQLAPGAAGVVPHTVAVTGRLGRVLLFRADAGDDRGLELWKTDGTRAGTRFVKDINPGAAASQPDVVSAVLSSTLFFGATSAARGAELWRSRGTASSTRLVKDIAPGAGDSNARAEVLMGGRLYFAASDGEDPGDHGRELWKSDGTRGGTVMVRDLAVGPDSSFPVKLARLGKKRLLFAAIHPAHGIQLFRSDGTRAGTGLLKVINEEGPMLAYPGAGPEPVVMGGRYFFGADDGTGGDSHDHGFELWVSDGTKAGTRLLKDINPGPAGTTIGWLQRVGKRVYFAADDKKGLELWVTDGTRAGTRRVKDIHVGAGSSQPTPVGVLGSTFYFAASDGPGKHGRELWRTDGTRSGTRMVRDIAPGGDDSLPLDGVAIDGTLLFTAENAKGRELWRTKGTKASTRMVADLRPGPLGSDPSSLTRLGKRLVFFADDGARGTEPWRYTP
jgi:ELWxxDGT repeat protein